MVGNDIVDLTDRDADASTLHPRFDVRVFTARERGSIAAAPDPARHRWRLWAAKEACYKLARQLCRDTVFSPRRFETRFEAGLGVGERILGAVTHAGERFRVEIREGRCWIHAVAVPEAARLETVVRRVARHAADARRESEVVRDLLCRELAGRLGVARSELEVGKQDRIPFVRLAGERLPLSLSLSHHGELAAFAYSPAEVRA